MTLCVWIWLLKPTDQFAVQKLRKFAKKDSFSTQSDHFWQVFLTEYWTYHWSSTTKLKNCFICLVYNTCLPQIFIGKVWIMAHCTFSQHHENVSFFALFWKNECFQSKNNKLVNYFIWNINIKLSFFYWNSFDENFSWDL